MIISFIRKKYINDDETEIAGYIVLSIRILFVGLTFLGSRFIVREKLLFKMMIFFNYTNLTSPALCNKLMKLSFSLNSRNHLDSDGVRVTKQWAKIMDKYDPTHNNEIMRWNRMVAKRNHAQADDFRK